MRLNYLNMFPENASQLANDIWQITYLFSNNTERLRLQLITFTINYVNVYNTFTFHCCFGKQKENHKQELL